MINLLSLKVSLMLKRASLGKNSLTSEGTTIGTKFPVLHCIRIPFLMRCGL